MFGQGFNNNVFKQYYCPWRYPSNWIKNIRLFFRRYKWAYQRAKRGYADCDIWNFDSYLEKIISKGLRELEHTLRGSSSKGTFGGNLKLMNESPETSFRGWDIDL